jgi:hypothetical protein
MQRHEVLQVQQRLPCLFHHVALGVAQNCYTRIACKCNWPNLSSGARAEFHISTSAGPPLLFPEERAKVLILEGVLQGDGAEGSNLWERESIPMPPLRIIRSV